jgi:hypothetical protein
MEGATSRATRNQVLSTASTRTKRLTTRGEDRRRSDAVQTNHSLPRHDDRIKEALALAGRQRHHHPTHVHSLSNEHFGRQPQRGARPRGLVAKSSDFQQPKSKVGTTLYRPVRIDGNTHLSRFNAQWRDPKCEDVDCLRMPDAAWQREANYCSPPWSGLPSLCAKIHQSGATPTFIAPYCPQKPWFQHLHSLATATIHYPASRDLFFPGRLARGGRTTKMERRRFSIAMPARLHTWRGEVGRKLRPPSPSVADLRSINVHPLVHPRRARYKLREPDAHAPWTSTVTSQLRKLLRTDQIGTTALDMLSSSLAPTTYANYDSGMRKFSAFCLEEDVHPLRATAQSIVRCTTWLGLQGTVAVASLQHFYSAIKKFFSDHQ